jgi:hypothetical protein
MKRTKIFFTKIIYKINSIRLLSFELLQDIKNVVRLRSHLDHNVDIYSITVLNIVVISTGYIYVYGYLSCNYITSLWASEEYFMHVKECS